MIKGPELERSGLFLMPQGKGC